MTWFKVDDGFWSHPKVIALSDPAVALWVRAGTYACQHRLGGFVPAHVLHVLGAAESANELVESGMWHKAEGGWRFHQWRRWQDGNYRPNISKAVKSAVYERDGHQCVACGATQELSLDHIIRYRDDGPDTVANLRVLCMPCNLERG